MPVLIDPSQPVETRVEPVGRGIERFLVAQRLRRLRLRRNFAPSPVYIASAPDWQRAEMMSELPASGQCVTGCGWLSDDRLLISSTQNHTYMGVHDASARGKIFVLDLTSGVGTEVASIPAPEEPYQFGFFGAVTDEFLLANKPHTVHHNRRLTRTPRLDRPHHRRRLPHRRRRLHRGRSFRHPDPLPLPLPNPTLHPLPYNHRTFPTAYRRAGAHRY